MATKYCYLFDIDGTLADCQHRLHHITETKPKNWREFFAACVDDEPIDHMIQLCMNLHEAGASIVYVSGRSDECREATERWLREQCLPDGPVYMRKAGDYRDDNILKIELLQQVLADGWKPMMAFDDRSRVVAAWREAGIPCAQVAPGDF